MTVEYEGHKAGAEDASEGNNHQNDSHSVTKGKELHLFGDAGSLLSTGPELWQAEWIHSMASKGKTERP